MHFIALYQCIYARNENDLPMQLTKDKEDINYNKLTGYYLETLDEINRLSSHLGDVSTKSRSRNTEEIRKLLLLWFNIQRKIAWKYIPAGYQKIMVEQSGLLSKNLIQSIRNLDFVYSYLSMPYQQSFGMWSDYISFWMQNVADTFGIYTRLQLTGSDFLYEQDRQFVEAIRDTDKAYENYDHIQNPNKKEKSKGNQNNSKTSDDTSGPSVI